LKSDFKIIVMSLENISPVSWVDMNTSSKMLKNQLVLKLFLT